MANESHKTTIMVQTKSDSNYFTSPSWCLNRFGTTTSKVVIDDRKGKKNFTSSTTLLWFSNPHLCIIRSCQILTLSNESLVQAVSSDPYSLTPITINSYYSLFPLGTIKIQCVNASPIQLLNIQSGEHPNKSSEENRKRRVKENSD